MVSRIPMHTAYKRLGFDMKDYPVARAKFENEITIPLHTKLTNDDVSYVIRQYTDFLSGF